MKAVFAVLTLAGLGLLVALADVCFRSRPASPYKPPTIEALDPARPSIREFRMTMPDRQAELTAKMADLGDDQLLHIYGGFIYTTKERIVYGDSADVDVRTGAITKIKGLKIWKNEDYR